MPNGNNQVRGGQGYEGVKTVRENRFFRGIVNRVLHMDFLPCKIRADVSFKLLIQDAFGHGPIADPFVAPAAAAGLRSRDRLRPQRSG